MATRYPGLQILLNGEFQRLKKSGRGDATMRAAARKMKVALGTLNAWKQGVAFPKIEKIDRLVKYFYPQASAEGEQFRARLERAGRLIRTLDDLKHDHRLRIAFIKFPPFCDEPGPAGRGFIGDLFARLLDLSLLEPEWIPYEDVHGAIGSLFDGTSDVGLSIIDTISGPIGIQAFHSACRISLNAICLDRDAKKVDRVREALVIRASAEARRAITPIAQFNHLGYRYLRDSLGFAAKDIKRLKPGPPSDVAQEFASYAGNGPMPVLVTDELTALEVFASVSASAMVFPLATEQAMQSGTRHSLPNYLLGLASVNAQQKELIEYLTHILQLLLHTEVDLVANIYGRLYKDLVDQLKSCLDRLDTDRLDLLQKMQNEPSANSEAWKTACAIRMARHTLRLNESDSPSLLETLNLPWRATIQRARQIIGPVPEGMESPRDGRLKLAYRPYSVFCNDLGEKRRISSLDDLGFSGELIRPLQRFIDIDDVQLLARSSQLVDRFDRADLRLGLFETLDRTRNWRFFGIPSRIPLNAVLMETDPARLVTQLDEAHQALSLDGAPYLQRVIEPIVLRAGSGHEYVTGTLGFSEICTIDIFLPEQYIEKLREGLPGSKLKSLRVVVVDLLTCLQILAHVSMEGKGRLVFPCSGVVTQYLPEYGLGFAIHRESPWAQFFADSFLLLLVTHPERIIRAYTKLYQQIYQRVRAQFATISEAAPQSFCSLGIQANDINSAAEAWAKRILYLDIDLTELPSRYTEWIPILKGTIQAIARI